MRYRALPNSDVVVSEVGFGLWTTATGWWGTMSDDDAVALLDEAYELGITFYDAADTYGNGRSEEQLARVFRRRRSRVVYATKFGYDWHGTEPAQRTGQRELPQDFSPAAVRRALEGSLQRLNTDYIDVWQMHNARMEQLLDGGLIDLLESFRRAGKIRRWGVTLGPAIGWLWEGVLAARSGIPTVQMIWNMTEQQPGDAIVRAAEEVHSATSFFVRVPHSSGMLEGRYTSETLFPPDDHRSHRPRGWLTDGLKNVEKLRFLAGPRRTLGQAAIQWLLANPRVASVLPNISGPGQLREFAAAPDTARLTAVELAAVAELAKENAVAGSERRRFKGVSRLSVHRPVAWQRNVLRGRRAP